MEKRLNYAPCGFLSINHEGIITDINQTFLQWMGYKQADLINKHIEILMSTPNKLIFHSYFYPSINLNNHIDELFISLKHHDGLSIPFLLNAKLFTENKLEYIDCILVKMKKRIDYELELRSTKKQMEAAYTEKKQALAKLEQIHLEIEQKQAELLSMNATLIELSETDKLTGLKNRRYFQEKLEEQLSNNEKSASPFSLFILDIDHFKKVNDTFGHQVGDEVLAQLAQLLKNQARSLDIVARYGGEEFVVILPETDQNEAKAIAEQLRQAVEQAKWQTGRITVSVGIATAIKTDNETTILQRADKALYASKENGRNRVTHSIDLTSI
ncbi:MULTISPECIES: sensor domain-containing diguanylate cyclase [Lysinibacillus]|uniref:sensor domain-containing diguanylate cyclase n=1 Tax=Lysinibacillus TaxID=400634 RepID=UPI00257D6351|nr:MULTISPECIES: diguanylate cyclase [Lysinibacillus]